MKVLIILFMTTLSLSAFATVRTVSNHPSTLAQFSTIQAAINASVSGDTILVHGSPVSYAGFTLSNKQLTLIGPGFSPDIQTPYKATINTLVVITGSGSRKTEIQGFYFAVSFDVTSSLDSVYFYRNHFGPLNLVQGVGNINGFIFRGNYFRGAMGTHPSSVFTNILFENNVFDCNDCISGINNGANINVLFNHNLFFAPDGFPSNVFASLGFAMFTNNIFVERNFNASVTSCTFVNNLTFNCGPNTPWTINGNANGGGNIENMDPQMVNQAAVNAGTAHELSNYTIAAGPANNAGTDGKDLGLLFDPTGGANWNHSRNARMPSVVLMNIVNPVLAAGANLNITVEARKNE